jgi:ferredoxin-NADP reductase
MTSMAVTARRLGHAATLGSSRAGGAGASRRLLQLRRQLASAAAAEHGRPDHMELTGEQERGSTLAWATIRKLTPLSPTVLGLELLLDDPADDDSDESPPSSSPPFTFAAGQWVDFHIPDVETIGGYSITSLPEQLPVLELAVKASAHPPAFWVTQQAQAGDRVQMRVGGEFVYSEPAALHDDGVRRLLFIAGGVGINPLYGMIRQLQIRAAAAAAAADDGDAAAAAGGGGRSRAVLLYSAGVEDELVFRKELDAMMAAAEAVGTSQDGLALRVIYTTTTQAQEEAARTISSVRSGRVNGDMIGEAIAWLGGVGPDGVYVCGPPGMAEEMLELCGDVAAVPPERVQFESWW